MSAGARNQEIVYEECPGRQHMRDRPISRGLASSLSSVVSRFRLTLRIRTVVSRWVFGLALSVKRVDMTPTQLSISCHIRATTPEISIIHLSRQKTRNRCHPMEYSPCHRRATSSGHSRALRESMEVRKTYALQRFSLVGRVGLEPTTTRL